MLAVSVLFCLLIVPGKFQAKTVKREGMPKSITEGSLIRCGDHPSMIPLKFTDVKMNVTAFIADVTVEQTFFNNDQDRIEAVYVFPLPGDAAVNDMEVHIGNRTIRSLVKKREEAAQMYNEAVSEGQHAALLEQERPNVFTASVGNIAPQEEVVVKIRYLQKLAYDDGGFKVQFPMVVAPRYMPGEPIGREGTGWSPDTTQVPDASRISPPVVPNHRVGTNVRLKVNLDAGMSIHSVRSLQHQVDMYQTGNNYQITLTRNDEIPNRDFILEYKVADVKPRASMIVSRPVGGASYFLMMAVPPAEVLPSDMRAKEMIFVIDTSGSMEGPKIIQARNALRTCLHGLNPQDSFNIIRFSSDFQVFSRDSVDFTQDNVDRADQFIDSLRAGGGTEIIPPLLHAFRQPDENKLRVVVFITDAEVGNDAQILKTITDNLGDSRLFTFGIDTAPNDYLMKKMAQFGRGAFEFVTPNQNIEDVIGRFQNRISAPVLTGVEMKWNGLSVTDMFPKRAPDLYSAQPVMIYGKVNGSPQGRATMIADSRQGTVTIPMNIEVSSPSQDSSAIAAMWARSQIDDLSDDLINRPGDANLKQQITDLGLNFKLVSSFTSFVAVEEHYEASPYGGPVRKVVVPVPLPESWDYDGVFGRRYDSADRKVQANARTKYAPKPSTVGPPAPSPAPPPPYTRSQSGQQPAGQAGGVAGGARGSASPPVAADKSARVYVPPVQKDSQEAAKNGPASGKRKDIPKEADDREVLRAESNALSSGARTNAIAQYLVRQQSVAGVWSDQGSADDTDSTAIALLGYLANGQTDRAGIYQSQVQRGLTSLVGRIDSNRTIKSQALSLWVLSEATGATNSSRYRSAAERLARQLSLNIGVSGKPDLDAAMWSLLALASAQKSGVISDGNVLTRLSDMVAADARADVIQRSLAAMLAGQRLSSQQRSQAQREIAALQPRLTDQTSIERAVVATFAARLLDQSLANDLQRRMLSTLVSSQSASGKMTGAFMLADNRPVADSARVYLLLNVADGRWAAIK